LAEVVNALPDEPLAAIRAKALATPERAVILVVPRGTRALQSPVGAKVLARTVLDYRLRLAIVTQDPETYAQMRAVGLSVFASVDRAEAARRWSTPPRSAGPENGRGQGLESVARAGRPDRQSMAERLLALGLLLVLLLAVGVGTAVLLPEATISVRPATQDLAAEVLLSVVTDLEEIDYESVAIPGRLVGTVITGTGSQATTSRRDIADAPASGTVLLINQRAMPVTVPAGTVVSTGSGVPVRFRTTAEAQLPGQSGASVTVPVEAMDPGPSGNVGTYLINRVEGALASQVGVMNEQPTSGGTMRQVGAVTEADRERLRDSLLQRLEVEANAALQAQLAEGEVAVPATLGRTAILGEGYDRILGESAEQITLTLRAEFQEVAFSKTDAGRIALAGLQGAVPEGYQLLPEGLTFEVASTEVDGTGTPVIAMVATGRVRALVASDEVKAMVLGRPVAEAAAVLEASLPLAETPQISTSPGWVRSIPSLGFRVHVEMVY